MRYNLNPRAIVAVMGGDVTGRDTCSVPGPGHSKHDRSLSIKIDPRRQGGFIVHSFAGDDWKTCQEYVLSKLGIQGGEHSDRAWPVIASDEGVRRRKEAALQIWANCDDPRRTLAERYLREHRGLDLPDNVACTVMRYHRRLRYDPDTYLPGLVCLLRDIETDEPCGIHRTFLNYRTAEKIDRKMLGVAKHAAIKLDADVDATLTIGEGVETVLSARAAGFTPAWALGSSGSVRSFPVLAGIRELTILQENDATSRRDVKHCADRYVRAGRPVNIIEPTVGNDFNDCWMART